MGGKKRPSSSRSSAGKKPRRATSANGSNVAKKRRLGADHVGRPRRYGGGPGLDVVDDFAALRAMHSNGGNTAALRQMEVFEWVGDAVIGELVARCLLSQFHHSPLSARVFRNLRLGVVTNQNLASVFDLIGYQRHTIEVRNRKTKEKADVVEAVAGEIVVRLELQKRDTRVCARLRSHLDDLIAAMLHEHFKERRRVHQKAVMSGPLRVSFNAFDCLPQEDLDEDTGELIVHAGLMESIEEHVRGDSDSDELQHKSIADLIEECEHDDKPRTTDVVSAFHSLGDSSRPVESGSSPEWELFPSPLNEAMKREVSEIYQRSTLKIRLLDAAHILRTSREIFDVFKIYGMAVLAERVSLALAFPHLSFRQVQDAPSGRFPSPSLLTTHRQSVLCMVNMERCAVFFGLTSSDEATEDEFATRRLRANTLRAFVGYYSAIAAEDGAKSIADDVASLLQLLAFDTNHDASLSSKLAPPPRREPLGVLPGAVTQATDFMTSQVCADLHEAGERPKPPSAPMLLLRKCDSETVEDLFETLARRSVDLERSASRGGTMDDESLNRRRKRKRSESDPDTKTNQMKPSANLTRFVHRRFLFCMEELVVLFAQRKTEECRVKMGSYEADLEPCAGDSFRKWEVSTSALTMALPESFHRLLLHDLCHFHALVSTSKTTRDGTRVTQLRLPLHYTWSKIQQRVTVEEEATG